MSKLPILGFVLKGISNTLKLLLSLLLLVEIIGTGYENSLKVSNDSCKVGNFLAFCLHFFLLLIIKVLTVVRISVFLPFLLGNRFSDCGLIFNTLKRLNYFFLLFCFIEFNFTFAFIFTFKSQIFILSAKLNLL